MSWSLGLVTVSVVWLTRLTRLTWLLTRLAIRLSELAWLWLVLTWLAWLTGLTGLTELTWLAIRIVGGLLGLIAVHVRASRNLSSILWVLIVYRSITIGLFKKWLANTFFFL